MNLFHYTETKKAFIKKSFYCSIQINIPIQTKLCTSVASAVLLTTISCTHKLFPCLFSSSESVFKHSSHVCVTLSLQCGLVVNEQNKEVVGLQVQHVITLGVLYYSCAIRKRNVFCKGDF